MSNQSPIPFDNTYIQLPDSLYRNEQPAQARAPQVIRTNPALAAKLNIDAEWFGSDNAIDVFAGNTVLPGSQPIATAYAGHQFGSWNPQLGDGRAILLGEVLGTDTQRYDIQLKGSGRTHYSRMGDGLSPLGPVLREYIISEAMAALGIPTTRSLAAVTTGERVVRDRVLPGAVLTRVARSHIRVGHFQFVAAQGNLALVKQLADHIITRDFPSAKNTPNPYAALLEQAISRQALLIAQWQLVGFIHGVMNTDNMLICGETIDYGPCAFMDEYDPGACFSSIDQRGRYAYKNQPAIAQWNLSWFAQALLPLLSDNEEDAIAMAQQMLSAFVELYQQAYSMGLLKKFGLNQPPPENLQFVEDFMTAMVTEKLDFTLTFRHLTDLANKNNPLQPSVAFDLPDTLAPLLAQWQTLLQQSNHNPEFLQKMYTVNPAHIPRNHLVEAAINAAQTDGDLRPFHRLVDVLATPYVYQPENADLTPPPTPAQVVLQTFCGT